MRLWPQPGRAGGLHVCARRDLRARRAGCPRRSDGVPSGRRPASRSAFPVFPRPDARAEAAVPGGAPEGVHHGRGGLLLALKEAGVDSLPGGGAEIFNPRVRKVICDHKVSGQQWLNIARTAHQLGLRSNATMLYGHIETEEERVEHLLLLRELQDETRGFVAFIPLAFHPENTALSHLPKTSGFADLKNIAVSRLLLDNFDHIKAYWIMLTPRIAQIALRFGANVIDGTVVEEKIYHDAGATTPQFTPRAELERLIREAGRLPVERDTLYRPVDRSKFPPGAPSSRSEGGPRPDVTLTLNV